MSPSQFGSGPSTPGNWSTVATPGTADHRAFDTPLSPPTNDPRMATVSGELEGHPPSPEESLFVDPHIRRPTQFSLEPTSPQPPLEPSEPEPTLPSEIVHSHTENHTTPSIETTAYTTFEPPVQPYQQISQPAPPPFIPTQQLPTRIISSPPTAPAPPPELTPKQIAQAQKHCRYAISALDYEDFERAKKDLLDALKIIEG